MKYSNHINKAHIPRSSFCWNFLLFFHLKKLANILYKLIQNKKKYPHKKSIMYLTTLGKRAISFTPEGYLNFSPNEFKKKHTNMYIYNIWYKNRYIEWRCINIYQNMREIFFFHRKAIVFFMLFDLVFWPEGYLIILSNIAGELIFLYMFLKWIWTVAVGLVIKNMYAFKI